MPVPPEFADRFAAFVAQPSLARQAIAGIDAGTLNRRPLGSDWSIRDHLVFLADNEQFAAATFHAALTTDDAALPAPDPGLYLRRLQYLWRDPEAALSLFQQARWGNAELLQRIDHSQWSRTLSVGSEPTTVGEFFASLAADTGVRIGKLSAR